MKPLLRTLFSLPMLLVFISALWAAKSGTEYRFRGVPDGSQPNGGLVADGVGNFYGTTSGGGLSSCGFSSPFCGTVFKLSPGANGQAKETILYKFTGGTDGAGPAGSLVFDAAGNLYGTTISGGNLGVCNNAGCGIVFKLSPNQNGTWTETTLYSFLGSTDAEQPGTGVIFDSTGNLYGAAGGGCIELCNGTIFKLSPNQDGTWTESIIYTFLGGTDGGFPNALAFDKKGNLFGTTFSGGDTQPPCDCGTVFELTLSSSGQWMKQILHNVTDGLDGGSPSSGVTLDSAGNLYGETFDGGSFACPQSGCGVVFQLTSVSGEWKSASRTPSTDSTVRKEASRTADSHSTLREIYTAQPATAATWHATTATVVERSSSSLRRAEAASPSAYWGHSTARLEPARIMV